MDKKEIEILSLLCDPVIKYLAHNPQMEVCISGNGLTVKQIVGSVEMPRKRRVNDSGERKNQSENQCNIGGGIR